MKLSVVIPCYKSLSTLQELVERLENVIVHMIEAQEIYDFEIVLVVDGSPDETAEYARNLASSFRKIIVLELQKNFGQHNALLAGIRLCTGDVVVTMDDDLQHHPEQIPLLVNSIVEENMDLAYGIAKFEEHGLVRSFASRTVKRGLSLSGVRHADWVSAFRAFRINLRDGFAEVNEPSVNLDVLLSWTTNRIIPVYVEMSHRVQGHSGYGVIKLIRHTLNMITGYGVLPLKIATYSGFAVGSLGFVILVTEIIKYLLGENIVAGFTTTIALLCVFSGVQLISIGLIGEYLGRMYFRSMKKPMYLVRSDNNKK